MQDLMFKATDKPAWDAFAATLPEGILIDEIGPIVTTPAVLSEDGTELTPAVIDNHHHVNVRVMDDTVDCVVLAQGYHYVQWIDPDTVDTPARIWAGGMNYWVPQVQQ